MALLILLRGTIILLFLDASVVAAKPDAFAERMPQTYSVNIFVVDENNQSVPGTIIEIRTGETLPATLATDPSGKATFTVTNAGTYLLDLHKKGYLPIQTSVEIGKDNALPEIDVVLSRAMLSQQTVEVKGEASSPVAETSSDPPTCCGVLTPFRKRF